MDRVLKAVTGNFAGEEVLRQTIMNHTPFSAMTMIMPTRLQCVYTTT